MWENYNKTINNYSPQGSVIIGEYSPRRSQGEYSPIITEPEANNCFSILVLKISVLLYSPVGEDNSLIRQI